MAVHTELLYAKLSELFLDAKNPRLGDDVITQNLDQDALLDKMRDWELEELAVSFLESGYWAQEALLAVEEKVGGKKQLVVVEGNRRLAALKYLERAIAGKPVSPKWKEFVANRKTDPKLFNRIPYLVADNRNELRGYLGFRHVSGIKEWEPAEKAEFIGKMIDEQHLSYQQVMRRIGSKTETVRRNYISYRILLQMRENDERIDLAKVEKKFSVLFLSLREEGVRTYLDVDIEASPAKAKRPIPPSKIDALVTFARWLFGDEKTDPIVEDSRLVGKFAKALSKSASRQYLERTENADLNTAYRLAGGEEFETLEEIELASTHLKAVLGVVHLYSKSSQIYEAVGQFGRNAMELLRKFPEIRSELLDEVTAV